MSGIVKDELEVLKQTVINANIQSKEDGILLKEIVLNKLQTIMYHNQQLDQLHARQRRY